MGYLPKLVGEGVFMYEGWCYNMNNSQAPLPEISGKIARARKRRARMSQEQVEAVEEKQQENIDEDIDEDTFDEVRHIFSFKNRQGQYDCKIWLQNDNVTQSCNLTLNPNLTSKL